MKMESRIVSDPGVMLGTPVIAGTRITVEHVLEEIGAGRTIDELIAAYPRVTRAGVQAAVRYATGLVRARWKSGDST